MITITHQEEKKLSELNQRLREAVSIGMFLAEDGQGEDIKAFCDLLKRRVPNIAVRNQEGLLDGLSGLRLGSRVFYHAVPLGAELDVFIEAIEIVAGRSPSVETPDLAALEGMRLPAELELFIAAQCRFCPTAVRTLIPLAHQSELITLKIIDGTRYPERARSAGVRSVPTLHLDGRFRWTGDIRLEELWPILRRRDPFQLSSGSLQTLIADGEAEKVSRMMLEQNQIFPAFLELLIHEKWPVRLGAMVAFEGLTAENRPLAQRAVPELWKVFPGVGEQVQGDIAYLLGQAGGDEAVEILNAILKGSYGLEVREAAQEALDAVQAHEDETSPRMK